MIPNRLKRGDTIGVVAPSNPIIGDNIEELDRAKQIVEKSGFRVKFSNHIYAHTNGYSSTAKEKAEEIKRTAKKIYRILKCSGFARVDLFLTTKGEIVFNEVNTIPGFTSHSRFPNMLKGIGMEFSQIIERLI